MNESDSVRVQIVTQSPNDPNGLKNVLMTKRGLDDLRAKWRDGVRQYAYLYRSSEGDLERRETLDLSTIVDIKILD